MAPGQPWDAVDWSSDPEWDWHSAVDDEPDELYALWYDAVARAKACGQAWILMRSQR